MWEVTGDGKETLFYVTRRLFFGKSQKRGDFGRSCLGSAIPRLSPLNFQGI